MDQSEVNESHDTAVESRFLAHSIAEHAWEGHAGEFERLLAIRSVDELEAQIVHVLQQPTESRRLLRGRAAYWDAASGMVVIVNPSVSASGTAVLADFDYYLSIR